MESPESIPKLLDLKKRIQERYTLRQLEELLQFFRIPTQHNVDRQCIGVLPCLAALQDVASACHSSSMAAPTAKRISSALDGIIYWMCIAMHVPFNRGDRASQDVSWRMDISRSYPIHSASLIILTKLALLDVGIWQKISFDPVVLDLRCVMWNVATRDGAPLLYSAGYHTVKGQGHEPDISLTALILKKNCTGLAAALQRRAVCDPKLFFTRAAQRMDLLGRLNSLPHLSHLPELNVEVFNVSRVIATTNSLVNTEPDLAKVMLEIGAPGKFVEALEEAAYRYLLCSSLTPADRTTCLERTISCAKLVVARSTLRPEFYLPTMKDLIEKGVINVLGYCLNMTSTPSLEEGIGQEELSEQCEALVRNILPWATSPELVSPLRSAVEGETHSRLRQYKPCAICSPIALVNVRGKIGKRGIEMNAATCARTTSVRFYTTESKAPPTNALRKHQAKRTPLALGTLITREHFTRRFLGMFFTDEGGRFQRDQGEAAQHIAWMEVVYTIDPGDTIEPMSIDPLPDFVEATIPLLPLYLMKRFKDIVDRLVSSNSPGSTERSRTMCMVNATYDTGRGYEANIIALLQNEKVGAYPGDPFPSFDIEASMFFTCPVRDRLKAVITTKGSLFPGTSYVAKNVGRGFKIAKVFAESQYRSTSSRTRGGQDLTSNSGYTRPSTPFDYYCSVKHQQLAIPGVF
ncbi:hypothetical protein FA13DRAFT_1778684 [Coprinellus micaceus]|uniref:Uncharacterized protein n=1 Tax=Coprinellus micaceus TaxID=71717 RepID=A0A4Y7SLD7_COPMI|nr:hypothetical protein FA13DRAFT_1778684 [Coprinellus micaceus]